MTCNSCMHTGIDLDLRMHMGITKVPICIRGLLCSCQLVVASQIFAPPPPLDAPLPRYWLYCRCWLRHLWKSSSSLYPVAPSSLLSTLLPVLLSQSSAVILCFRSACVCICMLKKNLVNAWLKERLLMPYWHITNWSSYTIWIWGVPICVRVGRKKKSHMGRPITHNE